MRVVYTKTFEKAYRSLPATIRTRVDKTIRLLASKEERQAYRPSLRAKRIQGTADIWEASVTMKYRLTFQIYRGTLYLRVVGDHDEVLKNP